MLNIILEEVTELLERYYMKEIKIDEDEIINIIINSQDDKFLVFNLPGIYILYILGLKIRYKDGHYIVIENMKVAFKKISVGDILLFINGFSLTSFFKEKATCEFIEIQAVRKINNDISIINDVARMPSIEAISDDVICKEIYKNNINYVYIKFLSFNEMLNRHLVAYSNRNRDLILDMRNHTGGNVNNMINCLKLFLQDGETPFRLLYKGDIVKSFIISGCNSLKFNNIFIIINKHTASSAEIFCASLKKSLDAVILGKRSYGKNVINKVVKTSLGNNLVIPICRVLFEENIFMDGVVPDIDMGAQVNIDEMLEKIDILLRR